MMKVAAGLMLAAAVTASPLASAGTPAPAPAPGPAPAPAPEPAPAPGPAPSDAYGKFEEARECFAAGDVKAILQCFIDKLRAGNGGNGGGGNGGDGDYGSPAPAPGAQEPLPEEPQAPEEPQKPEEPAPEPEKPAPEEPAPAPGGGDYSGGLDPTSAAFDVVVRGIINGVRAGLYLPPLQGGDPVADAMCMEQVQLMSKCGVMSHDACGDSFSNRAERHNAGASAENIADGQETPEEVAQAWIESSGHYKNIVNPDMKTVATCFLDGYWSQNFVGGGGY